MSAVKNYLFDHQHNLTVASQRIRQLLYNGTTEGLQDELEEIVKSAVCLLSMCVETGPTELEFHEYLGKLIQNCNVDTLSRCEPLPKYNC